MTKQQYDEISELYDITIPEPKGLLEYYKSLVKPGDDVLDLGCGTGRLSIEIAKLGANVLGVDISPGMVGEAKNKLKELSAVTNNIEFLVSDATKFTSNRKFDVVIMSGGVFEYLLTPFQQKKALLNIKSLLKKDGIFAFDVVTPPLILPYSKRKSNIDNSTSMLRKEGKFNVKSWDIIKADHFKQIVEAACHFEIYDKEHNFIMKKEYKFLSRYTLPTEMKYLLESSGFTIDTFYGDYERNEFSRKSEFMVYQCLVSN